jgi:hypothetical protein
MDAPRSPGRIRPAHQPAQVVKRSPRRFLRSSAVMFVGAALLCVWVTLTRDRNTERAFLSAAAERCAQIRQHWARTASLPPELVNRDTEDDTVPLEYYADTDTRFYAVRTKKPVIIGYTPMASMVAAYNARGVIFFQDGEVTARWMHEGDFKRLLAAQEPLVQAVVEAVRSQPPDLPD